MAIVEELEDSVVGNFRRDGKLGIARMSQRIQESRRGLKIGPQAAFPEDGVVPGQ
jgi:hypothetical protein